MRQFIMVSLVIVLILLGFTGVVTAQERPPAILNFGLSEEVAFTVYEVEYENKMASFSWQTVNLSSDYQLVLETYQVDAWTKITGDTPLPANTTDYEMPLYHPLNFGPMMYRLSIQDANGTIYDQRFVEINFAPSDDTPEITQFYVDTTDIVNPLVFNAIVYWEIANRRSYTNLEFDQILPNGSVKSIELPRTNLWVASFGHGTIQPEYVMGDIVIRLRVVDMLTGTVYTHQELTIAPPEVPNTLPTSSVSVATSTPRPTTVSANAPNLVYLTINPDPVNRLEPFVVSWRVERATNVTATLQYFIYKGNVWTPFPDKSIEGFGVGETSFSVADIHYSLNTLRIHLDVIGEDGQTYAFDSESFSLACFPMIEGAGSQCSSYEPLTTNASYQPFEHGLMIWRADTNQVYVLGGIETTGFFWQQFSVSEATLTESPPDGLFGPEGVFAGVWVNNENVQGVGWATAPAQSYSLQAQYYIDRATASSSAWFITIPQNIMMLIGDYTSTSGPSWRLLQ